MSEIAFIPVDIREDGVPANSYYLPYASGGWCGWDFFDLKRTDHESIDGSPLYLTGPPVVNHKKMGAMDFLIVNQLNYVVSGRMKDEMVKRKFTNIRFTELDVV